VKDIRSRYKFWIDYSDLKGILYGELSLGSFCGNLDLGLGLGFDMSVISSVRHPVVRTSSVQNQHNYEI